MEYSTLILYALIIGEGGNIDQFDQILQNTQKNDYNLTLSHLYVQCHWISHFSILKASLAEISSQHRCIPLLAFCVLLRLGFELRLVKSGCAVSFSETEKVYLIIIGFKQFGFRLD